MDRAFDLRDDTDVRALAELLPTIDGRTLACDSETLRTSLATLSECLTHPAWLVYRWGAVGPWTRGRRHIPFGLEPLIDLGTKLRRLREQEGFEVLGPQLRNFTQFHDTQLEVDFAAFLLDSGADRVEFGPAYTVKGKRKRPDLNVHWSGDRIAVECKSPHWFEQDAARALDTKVTSLLAAMAGRPSLANSRIEAEFVSPVTGSLDKLAREVVTAYERALLDGGSEFNVGAVRGHVVRLGEAFQLPIGRRCKDCVRVTDRPTGLQDPRSVYLRICDSTSEAKEQRSLARTIQTARTQLPEDQPSLIVIAVSQEAMSDCLKRREDSGNRRPLEAFCAWEAGRAQFWSRGGGHALIQRLAALAIT